MFPLGLYTVAHRGGAGPFSSRLLGIFFRCVLARDDCLI